MRHLLLLVPLALILCAGCAITVRPLDPPGKAKHADGPGRSEDAPGHNKKH